MNFRDLPYNAGETDLIASKGNQLHLIQLLLIGIYGAVFGIMNIVLGNSAQYWFNFALVPFSLLAGLLYYYNYVLASKLMNVLQANVVLALLALQTGPATFIGAFYLPVIIGSLMIFSGKQVVFAYISTAFSVALLIFLLFTDLRIGHIPPLSPDALKIEWAMNLIGAALLVVIQIGYLLALNNLIQKKILLQTVILNRQNEDLQQSIKTRDVFLSVVSHDLRSPLLLFKSAMSVFDPYTISPDIQLMMRKKCENRLETAISMAESVLIWAQTQQNRIKYVETRQKLEDIKDMLVNLAEMFKGEYPISYEIDFPEEEISFYCDLHMLELIFRNLVSNASKFTPENGKIIISAKQKQKEICFHVIDSGQGMEKEKIRELLLGENGSTAGIKDEKGFGVGLQLVQHFLRLHGSSLKIQSEPDKGSDFYFCLRAVVREKTSLQQVAVAEPHILTH